MFKNRSVNQVNINGRTIRIQGNGSICIRDGAIYVDGVQQDCNLEGNVTIVVEGNCLDISTPGNVEVRGSCKNIDCGGSATIHGDVIGNVDAGGSIHCGNVQGDADAGGSIHCKGVGQR